MFRQNIGAAVTLVTYVALLCANILVTRKFVEKPDSASVRQHLKNHRLSTATVVMMLILDTIAVAALMFLLHFAATRQDVPLPWKLSAVLSIAFLLSTSLRMGWVMRLSFLALAAALIVLIVEDGGVLAGQAVVWMFLVALMGAAATIPVLLGDRHTALPRYKLVSLPLWLVILTVAAVADVVLKLDAVRTTEIINRAFGFSSLHVVNVAGRGVSLTDAILFAPQTFNIGLFTTIALFMMVGALAMWRDYMGYAPLLVWPLALGGLGLVTALVVWWANGYVIAAPYITGGVIIGTLIGTAKSRMWQLIMSFEQGWHADQTHKLLWRDN